MAAFQYSQLDQALMQRAIELARLGRGAVEPNPMVGCVIDLEPLAVGWHKSYGGPHAEAEALAALAGRSAQGKTVYVTLEPCCHTNKKTPPCVPRLIEAKVGRVVVGCVDPNPEVCGRGIAQLKSAGIVVDVGLMEAACKQLIAPYMALAIHGRPYVTLKWAQSADGLVAGADGAPRAISSESANALMHRARGLCDAILVGIESVLKDDPLLTARTPAPGPGRPLARMVLDTHLRIPISARLIQTISDGPVTIFCSEKAPAQNKLELEKLGVRVEILPEKNGRLDLGAMLHRLGEWKMTHLLVEAGPTLARSFLEENLADRVWRLLDSRPLAEPAGIAAPEFSHPIFACKTLDTTRIEESLLRTSPVYFSDQPSLELENPADSENII